MAMRNPEVPALSYPVAVVIGLFGSPFMYMAARFVAEVYDSGYRDFGPAVSASFGVIHLVLGAVFGLVWPEPRWRWGVWLCGLPACVVSYLQPDAWFFANWVAMTVLPACAGAQLAARLHLRYTEAG
jgi:hypothetical protein